MRMVDIILKKREGQVLTKEEIDFVIKGYTEGSIPDYQVSSLLMAIVFNSMNHDEIVNLTNAMLYSGDVINLDSINGVKVDKHSTGGVGDKTSLVVGPLVAACGIKVAKMSGRGLGHTGGTLDKLESIPGLRIDIEPQDFIKQVNDIGIAIVGQTGHLVPADKKLYALRDVTGTVESIPLIASSIMSKKLASGTDAILLDVKYGNGAFMKTIEDAEKLSKVMVEIGKSFKKDTRAMISTMDQPLGRAVGNSLEVVEAINTLRGNGPKDFEELCVTAASIMLVQGGIASNFENAQIMVNSRIRSLEGLEKLKEMVAAQGGDVSYIENPDKFEKAKYIEEVLAPKDGYISSINALGVGVCAMKLGAGRAKKEDNVDHSAGIVLNKKVGERVRAGEPIALIHTNIEKHEEVIKELMECFTYTPYPLDNGPVVHEVIS